MEEKEEMNMEEKMNKAMETWDGTWKWVFTYEDYQTGDYKELGWYDTKEEATKALANLVEKVKKEHSNCRTKVFCRGKRAFIDVPKGYDIMTYLLSVWQNRSCMEGI